MIFPVFIEKLALPLLDWATAIAQALGHVAQGTLCADPAPNRAADAD
ncbi:MAG TPA: hypothetical protein PLI44_07050 [Chiayiivirga sp.]|jgi:hypothetical protein|nr:hypothetical protein [Xanthomonadaceae bacterium]MDX9765059.1 hypothetical protein [Chiayiivirga sp.]MEB2316267.1 hypothetical protein [Xanthomonadaceae bacterium]HMN34099.1 hypothetical protein [Chiayiivirga sp.]HRN59978.1 hypothetical protein [Chiayiivirga sp.]